MDEFDNLLNKASCSVSQERTAKRVRPIAYGGLTCLGRKTISGILTASGQQFVDWSAAYRLFSQNRIDTEKLFDVSRQEVLQELGPDSMLIAHMDDTIIKKSGKKVPGTAWRRDPLGPPFCTNFIWGQRFLQVSVALPGDDNGFCQSRAIPIDFHHCPTVKKPTKKATKEQMIAYKEQQKQVNLSEQGCTRIKLLREKLDREGAGDRELYLGVDGSYTNKTVLKKLPEGVTLIGRIRKDTRLHQIPTQSEGVGRKRVYGQQLPTPEQIRQSDQYQWQEVKAWAAGKIHLFNVKVIKGVRWEVAGGKHDLQLVIIRPLGYRLSKKSRILYRQPAYLICTDPGLDIEKLLQAYLWRWEIEVNFRDEKTLMGCGKAQVRNHQSVENVPAFISAIYSYLLIAAHKTYRELDRNKVLPSPKWYPAKNGQRLSTNEMINLLRTQMWSKAIGCNFPGFVKQEHILKARKNNANTLSSALFYMRN
jgi:hypothetical protein